MDLFMGSSKRKRGFRQGDPLSPLSICDSHELSVIPLE